MSLDRISIIWNILIKETPIEPHHGEIAITENAPTAIIVLVTSLDTTSISSGSDLTSGSSDGSGEEAGGGGGGGGGT